MASHRCVACTLMRCDSPGQVCDECVANGATQVDSLQQTPHHPIFTYSFSIPSLSPHAPPAVPPVPTPPVQGQAIGRCPPLTMYPLHQVAGNVARWLITSFDWNSSQQGHNFWSDVVDELHRIESGGTP